MVSVYVVASEDHRGINDSCVLHFRDLDNGRDNDQQPFSGYKHPRPEIIRTITNPYARTLEVRATGLHLTGRDLK